MQPGNPQPWSPSDPEYAPTVEPYQPRPMGRGMPRARTGLIVLTAFLVELVSIAAVCNQSVSDTARDYAQRHGGLDVGGSILAHVAEATLTYSWRFSPVGSDPTHVWPAQWARLLIVFVATALLVLAVVRGPVTFGRAFFGTWTAVIAATCLGNAIAQFVIDQPGRVTVALFGGVSGYVFIAGFGLGLFVALITALVAVATRRTLYPVPPSEPPAYEPPAYEPPAYEPPAYEPPPFEPSASADAPRHAAEPDLVPPPPFSTTELPDRERRGFAEDDRGTQQFPPVPRSDELTTQLPRQPLGDENATTQLPRIPMTDEPRAEQLGQEGAVPPPPGETAPPVAPAPPPAVPPAPAAGERTQFRDPAGPPPVGRNEQTVQFPRPPDDEDLGHEP